MLTLSKDSFPENPKIIFMGTPDFAVPSLKALIENSYDVHGVVTQPDRPKGRGRKPAFSPVKRLAKQYCVNVLQPDKVSSSLFYDLIRRDTPDLIIVVAFGQILKRELLMIPKWGVINIHASLLPKFRGAAPIQRAIINNESFTGLTIMQMDEGLDTGPMLAQEKVPILENESAGQLHDRLAEKSGEMIINFLKNTANKILKGFPQDDKRASYAHKIDKSMSIVDWTRDASSVSALIRGLDPIPGACSMIRGKIIKLFSSMVYDEDGSKGIPGRILKEIDGHLAIETGKGIILVREMQIPGKKRISSRDLLKGFAIPEGTIFGTPKDI